MAVALPVSMHQCAWELQASLLACVLYLFPTSLHKDILAAALIIGCIEYPSQLHLYVGPIDTYANEPLGHSLKCCLAQEPKWLCHSLMPESSSEIVCPRKHTLLVDLAAFPYNTIKRCIHLHCRGEIYPVETDERLCEVLQTGKFGCRQANAKRLICLPCYTILLDTLWSHKMSLTAAFVRQISNCLAKRLTSAETVSGQEVEVDLEKDVLTVIDSGKQYSLKSIGEVGNMANIALHAAFLVNFDTIKHLLNWAGAAYRLVLW